MTRVSKKVQTRSSTKSLRKNIASLNTDNIIREPREVKASRKLAESGMGFKRWDKMTEKAMKASNEPRPGPPSRPSTVTAQSSPKTTKVPAKGQTTFLRRRGRPPKILHGTSGGNGRPTPVAGLRNRPPPRRKIIDLTEESDVEGDCYGVSEPDNEPDSEYTTDNTETYFLGAEKSLRGSVGRNENKDSEPLSTHGSRPVPSTSCRSSHDAETLNKLDKRPSAGHNSDTETSVTKRRKLTDENTRTYVSPYVEDEQPTTLEPAQEGELAETIQEIHPTATPSCTIANERCLTPNGIASEPVRVAPVAPMIGITQSVNTWSPVNTSRGPPSSCPNVLNAPSGGTTADLEVATSLLNANSPDENALRQVVPSKDPDPPNVSSRATSVSSNTALADGDIPSLNKNQKPSITTDRSSNIPNIPKDTITMPKDTAPSTGNGDIAVTDTTLSVTPLGKPSLNAAADLSTDGEASRPPCDPTLPPSPTLPYPITQDPKPLGDLNKSYQQTAGTQTHSLPVTRVIVPTPLVQPVTVSHYQEVPCNPKVPEKEWWYSQAAFEEDSVIVEFCSTYILERSRSILANVKPEILHYRRTVAGQRYATPDCELKTQDGCQKFMHRWNSGPREEAPSVDEPFNAVSSYLCALKPPGVTVFKMPTREISTQTSLTFVDGSTISTVGRLSGEAYFKRILEQLEGLEAAQGAARNKADDIQRRIASLCDATEKVEALASATMQAMTEDEWQLSTKPMKHMIGEKLKLEEESARDLQSEIEDRQKKIDNEGSQVKSIFEIANFFRRNSAWIEGLDEATLERCKTPNTLSKQNIA